MDVSALLAFVETLAKEIGKGGGGSTEEPTVCFALLPVGLGVLFVVLQRVRDILWPPGGRTAAPLRSKSERKVQTA